MSLKRDIFIAISKVYLINEVLQNSISKKSTY